MFNAKNVHDKRSPRNIPIIFNQCLKFLFASKLLKYRFYTLKMQDIIFKEVLNAFRHLCKISLKIRGGGLQLPLKMPVFC